ncbi:MAG: hypothetical protein JNK72_06645 [Myxococcales bacterium]|nr:hypothetical protein [Myxococcales bacterium]
MKRPWRAIAAALWCAGARAEAQSLTLRWRAPDGCVSEAALGAMVREAGAPTQLRHDVAVEVTVRRGPRWQATLVTRHGAEVGERRLEARSCARLAQGVAAVVVLSLDEANAAEPVSPVQSVAVTRAWATPVLVEDDDLPPILQRRRPPPRPPVEAPRWRVGLGLRAHVDLALTPATSPGGALTVSLERDWFQVFTEFGGVAEGEAPRGRGGVALSALRAQLGLCARVPARLSVGLCAGVEGAALRAASLGFSQTRGDDSAAVGVSGRVVGGVSLGRAGRWSIEVEAIGWVTPIAYAVEGLGEVHAVGPVSARVGLSWSQTIP